jgi:hypothetical protein
MGIPRASWCVRGGSGLMDGLVHPTHGLSGKSKRAGLGAPLSSFLGARRGRPALRKEMFPQPGKEPALERVKLKRSKFVPPRQMAPSQVELVRLPPRGPVV